MQFVVRFFAAAAAAFFTGNCARFLRNSTQCAPLVFYGRRVDFFRLFCAEISVVKKNKKENCAESTRKCRQRQRTSSAARRARERANASAAREREGERARERAAKSSPQRVKGVRLTRLRSLYLPTPIILLWQTNKHTSRKRICTARVGR